MSQVICPECGARNTGEAELCELCGAPLGGAEADAGPAEGPVDRQVPAASGGQGGEETPEQGVFCNQCGWQNPVGAQYCSQCGARLQEGAAARGAARPPGPTAAPAASAAAPAATAETGRATRQTAIVVGAAVLVVVALYLITLMSRQETAPAPTTAPAQSAPAATLPAPEASELPAEQAQQVQALREELAGLEGAERLTKQHALVNLLMGFGRSDHAAPVQREIAEAEDTPAAWRRAGDLYFDWMERLPDAQRAPVALRAVEAYDKVLAAEPQNHDVRAAMAWAYQYDSQNAMQAIVQNNQVLEADPEHIQANFNRGIFLMRINRLDQAIEQLEKLKTIVGASSPYYRQADELIRTIRSVQEERTDATS